MPFGYVIGGVGDAIAAAKKPKAKADSPDGSMPEKARPVSYKEQGKAIGLCIGLAPAIGAYKLYKLAKAAEFRESQLWRMSDENEFNREIQLVKKGTEVGTFKVYGDMGKPFGIQQNEKGQSPIPWKKTWIQSHINVITRRAAGKRSQLEQPVDENNTNTRF